MGRHSYTQGDGPVPGLTSGQTGEQCKQPRVAQGRMGGPQDRVEAFTRFVVLLLSADSKDKVTSTERKTRERDGRLWRNAEFVTAFGDLAVSRFSHQKA